MAKSRNLQGHRHHRLTYEMAEMEIYRVMCNGKPAALALILNLAKLHRFDFLYALIVMDSIGIYGSSLFRLYTEICNNNERQFYELIQNLSMSEEKIVEVKNLLGLLNRIDYDD